MANISSAAWITEMIRLSFFPPAASSGVVTGWPVDVEKAWTALTGEQPEETSKRRAPPLVVASGKSGDGRLLVQGDQGRLDVVLLADPSTADLSIPFAHFAMDWESCLRGFVGQSNALIASLPAIGRVALAGVVLSRASSKEEAYGFLAKLLPAVRIDPDHTSDLMYQINRPVGSKVVDGLQINRLSKWNAIKMVSIPAVVGGQGAFPIPGEVHFARCEFDVNTSAEFSGDIPESQIPILVEELCNSVIGVVNDGDSYE